MLDTGGLVPHSGGSPARGSPVFIRYILAPPYELAFVSDIIPVSALTPAWTAVEKSYAARLERDYKTCPDRFKKSMPAR